MSVYGKTGGFTDTDVSHVELGSSFSPLPAGPYLVQFDKWEDKVNRNGSGRHVETQFSVIGGEYDGRKLWARFNYEHSNPKAVEIAFKEMRSFVSAALGQVTTMVGPTAFDQVLGAEFTVVVTVDGEGRNDISEFRYKDGTAVSLDRAAAAPAAAPAAPKAPEAPAAQQAPVWAQNG